MVATITAASAAAAFTVAAAIATTPIGSPPSGSLLWSNVSEAGFGLMFAGSAVPVHGGSGDVLLVGPSASGPPAINRMRAATGEIVWSVALKDAGLDKGFNSAVSLAIGASFGDPSTPVLVAWASGLESTIASGVDVKSGSLQWSLSLPFDEMGDYSFAGGVFLSFGRLRDRTGTAAIAYAINGKDDNGATLLFNVSIGGQGDWYSSVAILAPSPSAGTTPIAVLGTVEGNDNAPGSMYAVNTSDGTMLWAADNITATHAHVVRDVVVISADTRSVYGQDTKISLLRGYSLSNGSMLWQRSARGNEGIAGAGLARACDEDCTLPCDLVAADRFGAISPLNGETVFNTTVRDRNDADGLSAIVDGVTYSVHQANQIGRSHAGGRGYSSAQTGAGTLRAEACAVSKSAKLLWEAPLPVGDDGGSAPWSKILVVERTGAQESTTVLLGGHHQGACARGHCEPSHSAIAAVQPPHGIHPPPIPPPPPLPGPPAPPTPCHTAIASACAVARAASVDKCEVCCGMHAAALQKVGCQEPDFEFYCHTTTCDPSANPPQICPSGKTCPCCGQSTCECPHVSPYGPVFE